MRALAASIWRSDFVRAVLMFSSVAVGCVLPLDFIHQIDGYLKYLRPWEVFPVFGWAAIAYLLISLIGAVFILAASVCLGALLRKDPSTTLRFVAPWLSMSFVLHELIRTAKVWLANLGQPFLTELYDGSRWELNLLTLIVCAVLVMRRPKLFSHFYSPIRIVACIALGMACFTLLGEAMLHFHSHQAGAYAVDRISNVRKPNVVLITVDALNAGHMSLYGYPRFTTPNLSQLAQQATVFDRFYANGNFTSPSTNSLLHGVRPWTHRVIQLWARPESKLAEQGLIPRLHKAGYQTLVVSTNPAATLFQSRLTVGLDHITTPKINVTNAKVWGSLNAISYYAYLTDSDDSSRIGYLLFCIDRVLVRSGIWPDAGNFDPELAVSAARQLVLQRDERPFFLWVHLMPPHSPYATPPPFVGNFDASIYHRSRFDSTPFEKFAAKNDKDFPEKYIGRYDEAVKYVDSSIGHILDLLKSQQLFDSTLLIVTADHGESFSHDYSTHGGPMMLDDVIRIPLIIKEPGQTAAQRRPDLSEQIDLMPTILDLVGVLGNRSPEGKSLVPTLRGQKIDTPVYSMNFEQNSRFAALTSGSVAMIEGHWKYVHYMGSIQYPLMPKLVDSLHDLEDDPGENTNLITEQPGIASKMRTAIKEQLRIHGKPAL